MRIAAAIVAFIGVTTAVVLRDIPRRNIAAADGNSSTNASYPSGCSPLCLSGCSTELPFITIPSIIPPLTAPFSTTPYPTFPPPSSCGGEPTGNFPTGTLNHPIPTTPTGSYSRAPASHSLISHTLSASGPHSHYPSPSQPTTTLSSHPSVTPSGTPYNSAPNAI